MEPDDVEFIFHRDIDDNYKIKNTGTNSLEAIKFMKKQRNDEIWYSDNLSSTIVKIVEKHENIQARLQETSFTDILAGIRFDSCELLPKRESKRFYPPSYNDGLTDIHPTLTELGSLNPYLTPELNEIINSRFEDNIREGSVWKDNVVRYSNPFDPRLSFQGLRFGISTKDCNYGYEEPKKCPDMFNSFLDIVNPSGFANTYLNKYQQFLRDLREEYKQQANDDLFKVPAKRDRIIEEVESRLHSNQEKVEHAPYFVGNECENIDMWSQITATKKYWSEEENVQREITPILKDDDSTRSVLVALFSESMEDLHCHPLKQNVYNNQCETGLICSTEGVQETEMSSLRNDTQKQPSVLNYLPTGHSRILSRLIPVDRGVPGSTAPSENILTQESEFANQNKKDYHNIMVAPKDVEERLAKCEDTNVQKLDSYTSGGKLPEMVWDGAEAGDFTVHKDKQSQMEPINSGTSFVSQPINPWSTDNAASTGKPQASAQTSMFWSHQQRCHFESQQQRLKQQQQQQQEQINQQQQYLQPNNHPQEHQRQQQIQQQPFTGHQEQLNQQQQRQIMENQYQQHDQPKQQSRNGKQQQNQPQHSHGQRKQLLYGQQQQQQRQQQQQNLQHQSQQQLTYGQHQQPEQLQQNIKQLQQQQQKLQQKQEQDQLQQQHTQPQQQHQKLLKQQQQPQQQQLEQPCMQHKKEQQKQQPQKQQHQQPEQHPGQQRQQQHQLSQKQCQQPQKQQPMQEQHQQSQQQPQQSQQQQGHQQLRLQSQQTQQQLHEQPHLQHRHTQQQQVHCNPQHWPFQQFHAGLQNQGNKRKYEQVNFDNSKQQWAETQQEYESTLTADVCHSGDQQGNLQYDCQQYATNDQPKQYFIQNNGQPAYQTNTHYDYASVYPHYATSSSLNGGETNIGQQTTYPSASFNQDLCYPYGGVYQPSVTTATEQVLNLNFIHSRPQHQDIKFDDEVWYINGVPHQHAKTLQQNYNDHVVYSSNLHVWPQNFNWNANLQNTTPPQYVSTQSRQGPRANYPGHINNNGAQQNCGVNQRIQNLPPNLNNNNNVDKQLRENVHRDDCASIDFDVTSETESSNVVSFSRSNHSLYKLLDVDSVSSVDSCPSEAPDSWSEESDLEDTTQLVIDKNHDNLCIGKMFDDFPEECLPFDDCKVSNKITNSEYTIGRQIKVLSRRSKACRERQKPPRKSKIPRASHLIKII